MAKDITNVDDPIVATVLHDLVQSITAISEIQALIASNHKIKEPQPINPPRRAGFLNQLQTPDLSLSMHTLGFVGGYPGNNSGRQSRPRSNDFRPATANTANVDPDPVKTKFRDAVKSAEKATVIFNLDMGRVPLMNTDTMSRCATKALTTMAAKNENGNSTIPSDDAVAAIDDLLSVTKNMVFFGAKTKTYVNNKDPASGSFCTVPVKYEFKDRETRIQAEQTLRARCKVNCSTPYPAILRHCIKRVIDSAKLAKPDNFIRVNVDLATLSLKLSWRAKGENSWTPHDTAIPIPAAAFDISAKTVPDSICLQGLPHMGMDLTRSPIVEKSRTNSTIRSPPPPPLKNHLPKGATVTT